MKAHIKVASKVNRKKYLEDHIPSLQAQIDALFEGGQALADMKQRIKDIRKRVKNGSI